MQHITTADFVIETNKQTIVSEVNNSSKQTQHLQTTTQLTLVSESHM